MDNCDFIGMHVSIASMHIRRNLDALFSQHGCASGIQGRVLGELARAREENKDIYQKDVEKIFGIRRSSVNSLISNLESQGLIKRIPDPDDARQKKLELTELGIAQHVKIREYIRMFEESLADEFSEEEQRQLLEMMQRIIAHFHDTPVHDQITYGKEEVHD